MNFYKIFIVHAISQWYFRQPSKKDTSPRDCGLRNGNSMKAKPRNDGAEAETKLGAATVGGSPAPVQ